MRRPVVPYPTSRWKKLEHKMETGKACGSDQIPIEVWKSLGDEGLDYLLQRNGFSTC